MNQELSPLKRAFLALEDAQARLAAAEGAAREPIAIIGLGCRVPGADDPAAFWRLLRDGVDAVGPVPGGRFDLDAVHDAAGEASGRSVTREAAFLRQVDEFDPGFFGIARREAQGMDPQQRLLLEVSWEALEHAGQAPDRLGLSATGVYFGICTSDYANLQLQAGDAALIDAHYTSGVAHSVASGRLSYVLGLQGPSISIDTACSSSLVAVHLACQALRTGDCRMALAGGVNIMLSPDLFVAFSHSRMLAPDGRCKTFDAAADGFGRGEGCGVIVLKRLSDARADGDRILALIRGSAVNQDGPSSGLTAPNGPAQEAVIREALGRGGIVPNDVGYVEAHGTGTQLGDPLEMGALGAVFGPGREAFPPLLIGSVKTNLGHLEAAAGIAGLIKLVLALRHRAIPPHLHFRTPSPHIPWSELAVRVPHCLVPWKPIGGRRIGGVSSFGYSGTNAHVVVEEAPEERRPALPLPRAQLFLLSARDETSLRALAGRYADALAAATDDDVADACFTAATGRAQHAHRAALLVRSMAELREGLGALAAGREADGVRIARVTRRDPARLAFLFPGQGAQYTGMARALYETEAVFRDALDRCAAVLDPLLARPLLTVIHPAPGTESPLDETAFTQPALFAVEYALAQLWRAWGLRPDAVIGHSVGEYVAACLAGVLPLDDALRLIAERGRLMQTLPAGGAMAAIFAGVDDVRAAIAPWADRLSVAALNGAAQTVISGDQYAVDEVCAALVARGVRCQRLAVSHAFHSQLVEPVLEAFERAAGTARLEQPSMRLVSNVTGSVAGSEVATPEYWRRHMRDTVRFADGLKTLAASVADVWVEVGPHATLLPLAEEATAQGSTVLVPTLRRGRDDLHQLAEALGTLFLAGVPVDWRAVWSSQPAVLLDLPPYPFQRERCWFPQRASGAASAGRATGHPLLGTRLRSAQRDVVLYEAALDAETLPFFRDHQVGGRAILPATGFIEMALAAGRSLGDSLTEIHDLVLLAPLVAADDVVTIVQVVVRRTADGATFEILSQNHDDADAWQMHAQGVLAPVAAGASFEALDEVRARCLESLDAAAHQAALRERDLTFGPSLHGVRNIRRRDGEAIGEIVLPEVGVAGAGNYVLHPAMLDACLQVMSAALPTDGARGAFLPFTIDRVRVHRASAAAWSHVVQRSPAPGRKDTLGADVRVFDAEGIVAEITGITLRAAATDAAVPVTAGCRYEIQWMPEYDAAWMPQAETLASQAGSLLADLVRRHGILEGATSYMEIEAFSTEWVRNAFARLGWAPRLGEHVTTAEVGARLGVAPRYHRLLARLLGILAEDGLLQQADGGWCVVAPVGGHDPAARRAPLLAAHPERSAMITLVANCGALLADILRGDADPLQALFPGGSTELAGSLYRDAPEARVCNELARETLMAAVAALPRGRRLRVLEVGGGTGGTTACLAPALPADATEYLFTDVGPLLVAQARERFAGHPFMEFQTLDLEQEPSAQGLEGRRFDVIVAANVVHATADLRRTLRSLRDLLAPGGMLLMLEVAAPERWVDVTFGLTDGWWRFTDTELRPSYPLLSRTKWLDLLSTCGFQAAAVGDERTYARAALLVARRTSEPAAARVPERWLLLADEGGVGAALAAGMRQLGHQVTLLRSDLCPASPGEGLPVDTEDVDEVRGAVAAHLAGVTGVVHLWSLDLAPPPDTDAGTPVDAQRRSLGSLLGAVQGLGGASFDSTAMPRLWVATCGAQPVTPAADVNVAQAPVWGMGRVIELEHPELRATRVDLDENASAGDRAADLLGILLSHSMETQVAVRSGTRYVARLVRLHEPAESVPMQAITGASGVLDDLTLIPATRRHPAPGEVEIRVRASGLNFRDVLNAVAMRADPEPLGGECVGRIVAVGEGVSSVAVGDDVLAIAEGCFATYVTADARFVAPLPNGVGHAEAATVPLAFMTAHHALRTRGGILEGETVLIHAGAGGVGMAAIQVAQRAGAVVLATAGSDRKRAVLRALGVAHVFDSRSTAFADQVLAATGGRGVDVLLNSLAGDFIAAGVRCLAPEGRFLEIGKRDLWTAEEFRRARPRAAYHIVDLNTLRREDPPAFAELFNVVVRLLASGDVSPLPLQVFPLERIADAFRAMAQARHVGKVVLVQDDPVRASLEGLVPGASYLVTGGLSGLGLLTAERLVARGARCLALVGRRPPSDAAGAAIGAMRARGAQVLVVQADVSHSDEVARVIAEIEEHLPPLRGIVHAAGVLEDGALQQQSWARFAVPLGPKVEGSWALHTLTCGHPLDFFVMYSSAAAVLGSQGQANHAAANAFMDALAVHRRACGLPALSIGWGVWGGIGAAADRGIDRRAAARGVAPFTPEEGLALLESCMPLPLPHVGVFRVRWDDTVQAASTSPFLSQLRRNGATVGGGEATPATGTAATLMDRLDDASPTRRREMLLAFVAEQVARVLAAPSAAAIDSRQPLNELGLDSLMAVELRNRLGRGLGLARSLPATLVFDHPTLEALSSFLEGTLDPESKASVTVPSPADAVVAIDDMSDAQIEHLFARRMQGH